MSALFDAYVNRYMGQYESIKHLPEIWSERAACCYQTLLNRSRIFEGLLHRICRLKRQKQVSNIEIISYACLRYLLQATQFTYHARVPRVSCTIPMHNVWFFVWRVLPRDSKFIGSIALCSTYCGHMILEADRSFTNVDTEYLRPVEYSLL